jgi:hypothetical protein
MSARLRTFFQRVVPLTLVVLTAASVNQVPQVRVPQNLGVRLGIVTATSADHAAEHLEMVRSLTEVGFSGMLTVYFMYRTGEIEKDGEVLHVRARYSAALSEVSPSCEVIFFQVNTDYETYCFKPVIVQDYLNHVHVDVMMWTDSSTRFKGNPETWALNMVKDGIHFSGREGAMGMGENTHIKTYEFFRTSALELKERHEIQAGHWLADLNSDVFRAVIQPWIDCAVRSCHTCMSPSGSVRKLKRKQSGPPSTEYIGHRQDQSVLSILLAQWHAQGGRLHLNNHPRYIDLDVVRSFNTPL